MTNSYQHKITVLVILICSCFTLTAQSKYAFSGHLLGGYLFPADESFQEVSKRPVLGGELAFEFLPQGDKPWQRWWNMPTVGVALYGVDLGNEKVVGQLFAVYPYINLPVYRSNDLEFRLKLGLGLGAVTRTWNNTDTVGGITSPNANGAIGSILNGFMILGANVSIPIHNGYFFNLGVEFNHISNGNIFQPNSGLNTLALTAGASYHFNYCKRCEKPKPPMEPFPYKFAFNITLGGGTRELFYKDHHRYAIGSVTLGCTYQLVPNYAIGGGLDLFYDGAFVQQGTEPYMSEQQKQKQQQYTTYNRYLITDNSLANKLRAGICLMNEFPIARVTILLDWGIYLYNPIKSAYKHIEPNANPPEKIFYAYDIHKEDGWNYFRLGLRCRIYDNLYGQVYVKSHLYKGEFVAFCLGYQLPYGKKENYSSLTRGKDKYSLYHPDEKHKRGKPAYDNTPQPIKKEKAPKKSHKKPKI